jgi:carboxylesterase
MPRAGRRTAEQPKRAETGPGQRVREEAAVALRADAEPFQHDGGHVGVLLCHGFTGSPVAMRPWADYLAAQGLSVALPCLPGHGTRWQDMQLTGFADWYAGLEREFTVLAERCEQVFVMGLSMGGALSLRLAEEYGDAVAGLVLVNPAVVLNDRRLVLLPVIKHLVPSLKGISDDIRKEGVSEGAYDRTPLRALHSLRKGMALVQADLPKVTQPLLLFRSPEDHVVPPESARVLLSRVSSTDVEERLCEESYHVATVDNDAERIFAGSLEFVRRLSPGLTSTATSAES